ncbi:MAG: flavin reductase (DIM6/NTAB) family NADH-FMN oxidoreductase RutF [Polaribacter sp.]|jgi:flavin reductase (DIM6/NTAB) family NADH-FMN oxidoreductase RutF
MTHFKKTDFKDMDQRYRTQFINSLSGFKSVNLVGTVNESGHSNLSVVSSVFHIGANPALMGFIMRPITVTRDTYHNIITTRSFTFNHIHESFYKKAHQTSARYSTLISEFKEVGLTEEYGKIIKAPYVKESAIKVGLSFREKKEIELNGTVLMIGEVMEVFFPEDCITEDGYLNIEAAGSLACSGLDTYHKTKKVGKLSYPKTDKSITVIKD